MTCDKTNWQTQPNIVKDGSYNVAALGALGVSVWHNWDQRVTNQS